ncbi:MAG: hypothetical protein ACREN2_00835 [Candidatus Dormibacteria bacterium]
MPILRRKPTPVAIALPSGLRCQAQGCSSSDATTCSYRDRRGRSCRSVFCSDHSVTVDDDQYCRRHGGTMRALGTRAKQRAGLPDIDNRGPSLLHHVASALEHRITALLHDAAHADEQVITETEVTKAFDPDRSSRWERGWRLVDDTGVSVKVSAFVTDQKPETLYVRVGSQIVYQAVPPWISRRLNGQTVTEAQDEESRREFYAELEATITAAIIQVRETADHPAWAH